MITTSNQAVCLTREQRDGLRDFVMSHMCCRDLGIFERHGEWAMIRDTAVRLTECIPIVDQLGWDEHGDQDQYTLKIDETFRRIAAELREDIESTIRDDGAGDGALAQDRAALAAVDLIEGSN